MKQWNSILAMVATIIGGILLGTLIMKSCSPPTTIVHQDSAGLLYGVVTGQPITYKWPYSKTFRRPKDNKLVTEISSKIRLVFPVKLDVKNIDIEKTNKELLYLLFRHAYLSNNNNIVVGLVTRADKHFSIDARVILSSKFIYRAYGYEPKIWLEQSGTEGRINDAIYQ